MRTLSRAHSDALVGRTSSTKCSEASSRGSGLGKTRYAATPDFVETIHYVFLIQRGHFVKRLVLVLQTEQNKLSCYFASAAFFVPRHQFSPLILFLIFFFSFLFIFFSTFLLVLEFPKISYSYALSSLTRDNKNDPSNTSFEEFKVAYCTWYPILVLSIALKILSMEMSRLTRDGTAETVS